MTLKRVFVCVAMLITMAVCMTGCVSSTSENEAIHQKLMGAWVPLEDFNQELDAEGNVAKFTVYEFNETQTIYHIVEMEKTFSSLVNEYTISDGKYKVVDQTGVQFAKIEFTEEGNMLWITDSTKDEFRPLTEEEIETFAVPLNKEDLFTEDETEAAGAESVSETSAAE